MGEPRIAARDVADSLARDCEALFYALISDAAREGHELRGHAPGGGVVSMVRTGRKRGLWCNWNIPEQRGDALDFVAHMQTGGDATAAFKWALGWLGLSGARPPARPAGDVPAPRVVAPSTTPLTRVRAMWTAATGDPEVVTLYLAGRLGLDPADLWRLPALRFHPRAYHSPTDTAVPAMVAPMIGLQSWAHVATHVTYLRRVANGWHKASLRPAKRIYGSYVGAVVPLSRGASGKPLAEIEPGDSVLIGEGIENTAAALYLRDDHPRTWAAGSLANLAAVKLPCRGLRVCLVRDEDESNAAAGALFCRALDQLAGQGAIVDFMASPGRGDMAAYLSRVMMEVSNDAG